MIANPLNQQNTIRRRLSVLATLPAAPEALTRQQAETWWGQRTQLAPATRAADLSQLRAFYTWARRFEHRADDPTIRLDPPRLAKGLPRPAGKADVDRLLQVLPEDLRRGVALGAYAGLRAAETAALLRTPRWWLLEPVATVGLIDLKRLRVGGTIPRNERSTCLRTW